MKMQQSLAGVIHSTLKTVMSISLAACLSVFLVGLVVLEDLFAGMGSEEDLGMACVLFRIL